MALPVSFACFLLRTVVNLHSMCDPDFQTG